MRAVPDATDMNRQLARERYDLMILDLMLPGEDGLSICRRLRGGGENMPIIMLTAKGDDVDRIVGLEVGADDYLPKPFNPRELVARIQAVLRRRPPAAAARRSDHRTAGGGVRRVPLQPRGAQPDEERRRTSRSPPASSRCSRCWCSTRARRSRATS